MKKNKRYTKKHVFYANLKTGILFLVVVVFGYVILDSSWFTPRISELSASYISLKNTETTDILKVTNLSKQTDKRGKSRRNKSVQTFKMTGQRDTKYQIVLYHLGNVVEEEYIKFYLVNEMDKTIEGVLKNQPETYDGGKVLFEGNMIDGQNWTLRMWVDDHYHKNVKNVSYEIRIKQVR
ncbi:MAG: hypothetical protein IKF71_03905 [Bacilli bacterium]|nr:hypothetical protein [Bacilli bacterium]